MIKRAAALLALLALCGLLPAVAQETETKSMNLAEEAKKVGGEMAEKAAEAEAKMEKAEEAKADEDAPSLDEILAAHYEALGGTEAWGSVEAVRFEGTMTMGPGMEAPFKMTMKRPEKIRMEFIFQGMTGIQAADGEAAWMVMPFMGKKEPEAMSGDMARQLKDQADIEGPLFDWADKGHEVVLEGAEDMEGTDVYKIKVTQESGDVRYHYLDSEYHLTVKMEGKTNVQGQEVEVETSIGDYKQVCLETSGFVDEENPCDGKVVVMPFSIESRPQGAPSGQVISIATVEFNPDDIPEDYFAMPPKEAAKADPAEKPGE